ncbi:MAG TPA: putative metal-dependent hydrolase [Bacteroidetes bacterium]|nr:putative metal-dependent hydrolase [Bacteroidota bacterium]
MSDDNLKYPVGKYDHSTRVELDQVEELIEIVDDFSEDLTELVVDLDDEDLDKTYREGGWTIRQVISHCADSHMNAFMRFKLALTEENPTIKPYHQSGWASLPDADEAPVELSLLMIDGVHGRWVWLMDSMDEEDWNKTYYHPEQDRTNRLIDVLGLYAWHCRHHLEHIKLALRN